MSKQGMGLTAQQALLALRDVGVIQTRKGPVDEGFHLLFSNGLAERELRATCGKPASDNSGSWATARYRLTDLGRAQADDLARTIAARGW